MMSKQQKRLGGLVTILGLCIFDAQALPADMKDLPLNHGDIRQIVEASMQKNRIVGLSIAMVDDQTVEWAEGFGYADKVKKLKATPETVYRAGSISKLFTATAAMQLVEQGKLNIDRPLQTYVPEFAIKTRFPEAGPITPRQLMTHHSGLPSEYLKGWNNIPAEPFTRLAGKLSDEYAAFPPNFMSSYSNLAVSLLGTAVENACGKAYNDCMQQNVLQPLAMADSEFGTGGAVSLLMSKEYQAGKEVPVSELRDVPAGGLNSSVLDLSRFMRMVFADGKLDGRQVLTPATLKEMLRPQYPDMPLDLGQQTGLAWGLSKMPSGENLAGHDGRIGNFCSYLLIMPERKLGVVVLANTCNEQTAVAELGYTVLESMWIKKSAATLAAQPLAADNEADTGNFQDFFGYYAAGIWGLVNIDGSQARMRIKAIGHSAPLAMQTNGSVKAKLPWGEWLLTRAKLSGHEVLLANGSLFGEKLAPPTQLSASWRERLGHYQVTNRDGDPQAPKSMQLKLKNGYLLLTVAGYFADQVITPVNDTEAVLAGLGRNLGDTISFETQGKDRLLRYSGYVSKRK